MNNNELKLKIAHLYPANMNIYGDRGNIIVLMKRCSFRNIQSEYIAIDMDNSTEIPDADIYFFGGGQDKDQMLVYKDLLLKKNAIAAKVAENKVFLLICGGFQLFGKYFIDSEGNTLEGLSILDIETKSAGAAVSQRCIGNIVIETSLEIEPKTIVGFENHSGQTYLGREVLPLGRVKVGYGNNVKEKLEGCLYKNIVGSYMHGSLLPKNPHLADYLIHEALKNRFGQVTLDELNNTLEMSAHNHILQITGQVK